MAPIAVIIGFFQFGVLRQRVADPARVLLGFAAVIAGLAIFLVGLEVGLFPLGRAMARQLAAPEFVAAGSPRENLGWTAYGYTYLFALCLGFATTIAEPALISVAVKAGQVSGGTINPLGLRIAVALGSGIGVALGTIRICADSAGRSGTARSRSRSLLPSGVGTPARCGASMRSCSTDHCCRPSPDSMQGRRA